MSAPLVLLRADRASRKGLVVGERLYYGLDAYGCASDDTRATGIEHISVSTRESGLPFFTIPYEDVKSVQP